MKITQSPQSNHNLRKGPPKRDVVKQESEQPSNPMLPLGPTLVGGAALAMGASMLFPKDAGTVYQNIAGTISPTLKVVGPILDGVATGAFSGALAGLIYARVASGGKPDAEPLFAAIGGSLSGLALGAVTGGISAACGVTPLLAIPVSLVAGVAFSYRDYLESR